MEINFSFDMENLRYLLATIAALTLVLSIVSSSIDPNYFVGMNAFAENGEEDNSDSTSNNEEDVLIESLGNSSKVTLKIDDNHVNLKVEIEDSDLEDGIYDVMFACNSSNVSKEFLDALDVEEGHGEFATEVALSNGTYMGCEVDVGELSATFASFSVMSDEDDGEDDRGNPGREKHERGEREHKQSSRLETEDEGIEIKVEVEGLNMIDGSYDIVFACQSPNLNRTLDNAFKVEDGKGKFEAEIRLANGTYSGCEVTVGDTVLASFDAFTVSEETEEEQESRVEEKRKEKRERIVITTSGREIHERHRSENAANPGEYELGWNYVLTANGTAMQRNQIGIADRPVATVDINMTVWKSTGAIILLDVLDGTVEIGNQTYTVVLGYALYMIPHDTLRVGALVVDDDGNVYKLKLRGTAEEDDAEFPMESGSIDLTFEGSSGPLNNRLGDWELTLEGTVEAG